VQTAPLHKHKINKTWRPCQKPNGYDLFSIRQNTVTLRWDASATGLTGRVVEFLHTVAG
jgi:hypothetical protein